MPNIDALVALRTNASVAHYRAVELGMGIGGLATYLVALGTDLIPVDIGIRHQVDIWMAYHPDVRSVARVATFIDWLRTLFDPKRYPWFGDEFIHPREFATADHSELTRPIFRLSGARPGRQGASRLTFSATKSADLSISSRQDTPPARAQPSGA